MSVSETPDADRWIVINGRRWRRTDPSLPRDIVERLKSHLGAARSDARTANRSGDVQALTGAHRRVGLAKTGLGERGPYWWEQPHATRLAQAQKAIEQLDRPHTS